MIYVEVCHCAKTPVLQHSNEVATQGFIPFQSAWRRYWKGPLDLYPAMGDERAMACEQPIPVFTARFPVAGNRLFQPLEIGSSAPIAGFRSRTHSLTIFSHPYNFLHFQWLATFVPVS
jgi:hypothetical protein